MTEYDNEPIPGLPGILPPGETIVWQGSPDWRSLARTAFHTRLVAVYFAGLSLMAALFAVRHGAYAGLELTVSLGLVGLGLLHVLAWGSARTTIYTLTNRRIVFRIGMAVPKCINLPLGMIASVDFAGRANGTGDLPLTLIGAPKLGYVALWPHARPLKIARPAPMMRSVPQAATVAALVARTCLAANPNGRIAPIEHAQAQTPRTAAPAFEEAHPA
ncbi:photosynthetic complex putative assembly protein PuhB [Novosphingobium sp.]|uniref:photosynthetic complex putative assembly protein PuhB n=1 Tax=Novosphingobium sp. TaxID=1874826 RepID=UPI003B524F2A